MRGFPIEYWKRGVRRRADDLLLMIKEKDQYLGLVLQGGELDPDDARRSWGSDRPPEAFESPPFWVRELISLHACRGCREHNIHKYEAELDRFESFMYEWLETKHPGDRAWISRQFDKELRDKR